MDDSAIIEATKRKLTDQFLDMCRTAAPLQELAAKHNWNVATDVINTVAQDAEGNKFWVPNQQQLQRMSGCFEVWDDKTGLQEYVGRCEDILKQNPYIKTFDELWLAIYMRSQHHKAWNVRLKMWGAY